MNKLAELWSDIVQCWSDSSMQYLTGALKTIELAVIATIIGCLIGLVCGIILPCHSSPVDFGGYGVIYGNNGQTVALGDL